MKTIIAGSRSLKIDDLLKAIPLLPFIPTLIISGTAKGIDQEGEKWGKENGIPIQRYPARWDLYGMGAGFRRNELMASKGEALLAVWDGESSGTSHMISIAKEKGLQVFIYNTKEH